MLHCMERHINGRAQYPVLQTSHVILQEHTSATRTVLELSLHLAMVSTAH